MKCCTFCSKEVEMLFNHMTNDVGALCLECYMKLQGSCAVCSEGFLPESVQEGVKYRVKAKFVGMGDKNIVVCDCCYSEIQRRFPEMIL
ncbi:hypothetical protein PASE110613_14520 [Paenibacillus sediminis]|uniref:Uncharacterized protein n=1 Tax=Paenibacillus sediminis TaxID=664909 RepID=A0ABS4H7I8_9BACL|nr:hypothetical protein [Paenibacillus sediminis]